MKKYNYILSQYKFCRIKHLSNVALSLRLLMKEFYMEREKDKKSFHGRCILLHKPPLLRNIEEIL